MSGSGNGSAEPTIGERLSAFPEANFFEPDRISFPGVMALADRAAILGNVSHLFGEAADRVIGAYGDADFALNLEGSVLSKILYCIGATVVAAPDGSEEFNIWLSRTRAPKPEGLRYLINGRVDDTSKPTIDRMHGEIFGRTTCVSAHEIQPDGIYIVRPETGAMRGGRLVRGVDLEGANLDGGVVQRIIDNRVDACNVCDIRIVVIGREIPLVYIRTRPISMRFADVDASVVATSPLNVLSEGEIEQVLSFCRGVGLDYGELDALRDANEQDLWIVDVHPTPVGPPFSLSKAEVNVALREMSLSFYRQFLSPGLFFASERDLRD